MSEDSSSERQENCARGRPPDDLDLSVNQVGDRRLVGAEGAPEGRGPVAYVRENNWPGGSQNKCV